MEGVPVEILNFMLIWLGISAVPYAMYLVAFVFESRKPGRGPNDVPVWKDQSRAFLPGDFGLTLAVTSIIHINGQRPEWSQQLWWNFASMSLAFFVFWMGVRVLYSKGDYTPEQWRSPSKLWHDIVMFFMFTWFVAFYILPKLLVSYSLPQNPLLIALVAIGMLVWVAGCIYDAVVKQVPNARQHPSEWKPIWKKER